MELNKEWAKAFDYSFETDEEVVDFIIDNLDTRNFEDSYVDAAGYGEPNECFKETVDDKKELLRDFLIYLLRRTEEGKL